MSYDKTIEDFRRQAEELGVEIPVDEDISVLGESVDIGGAQAPNRFCVQPMEGCDGGMDGAPGTRTLERYLAYARGGFGLIWFEATAVVPEGRSGPNQLYLHKDNVDRFRELVEAVRSAGGNDPVLILQLAHAGRFSVPNPVDAKTLDTDRLGRAYVEAARLAAEAGFDGVDLKCCHDDLICDLKDPASFLKNTYTDIDEKVPGLFVTTRLGIRGADDMDAKIRLAGELRVLGMPLLNVSVENTFICSDAGRWDDKPVSINPVERHPLEVTARVLELTAEAQKRLPGLPVAGGCYSWLGALMPQVASGVVKSGGAAFAGIGRGALAYPDMVNDILADGAMIPGKCCIACSACMQLLRAGGNVGCVIHDELYGFNYRRRRRSAPEILKAEALRCHDCRNAPCIAACPAGIDIPGFVKAYADGDITRAYGIIRERNILPEMCSLLCPVSMMCEGACVETALTGHPVAIADIQHAVSRGARDAEKTGISLPDRRTGKHIAVVGAGPAGVACVAGLLKKGHEVTMYEAGERLGGTPEGMMRPERFRGGHEEMESLLRPALRSGRLEILYQYELGNNLRLKHLQEEYDATVIATGLWQERSLGKAQGVVDAVRFLKDHREGRLGSLPARVALLSGGDCAMDAAVTAHEAGVGDLFIVYAGSMSEMHWHLDDVWFRRNGVHCLFLNQPMGYEVDDNGVLKGLRICGVDPLGERLLEVDMVIEAMGLGISDVLKNELDGVEFTEHGLVKMVRDGSFAVGPDNVFAAGGIINGGATVVQCVAEGMKAAEEINGIL